ncbi:MAG: 50S ribosomal protein L11 methyltransferase [Sphaerobacteraceae bacterium]|nr:MAG: 50S ribosomal protein L11 methyltransferase [Sphaerobacteraceae bacterium]
MVDQHKAPDGRWVELSVAVDSEAVEPVSELMSRHAYGQGVAVYEQYQQDPDGDNLAPDPTRPVTVVAYLPLNQETEQKVGRIEEGLWHLRYLGEIGELERAERPEEDWANAWKEHFQVLRIGERFVIRPTWREYEPVAGDLVIDLDPGMAFGTGHHPTTELCLRWMEEVPVAGKRVLDVGAGSGILSIAAILLDAQSVHAVEIDEVAARALRENLDMNRVGESVLVSVGDFSKTGTGGERYDLVIANIISSVLTRLATPICEAVDDRGQLLLSGVIEQHIDQVRATFTAEGMKVIEERQQGDWIAMLLERNA